ncbi:Fc.00g070840.m01.CDS01 [Cosmosporella sp. VM-42]
MAEVLGIISSAITVAQVAGHIGPKMIALKRLWDEVRDIPETIDYQMKQLELLCPVIDEMENEFLQARNAIKNDSVAKRSFELCRQAVAELESLIERLQLQISSARKSKKRIAKLRVTLKQHLVDEHQRKLDYALRLLGMSHQTYLMALTRLQPAMIVSEFQAMQEERVDEERAMKRNSRCNDVKPRNQENLPVGKQRCKNSSSRAVPRRSPWSRSSFFLWSSYEVVDETGDESSYFQNDTNRVYQVRLQLPWWLLQKAWDFHAHRTYGRWTILLTSWNICPEESEIFDIVQDQDARGLQQALQEKKASLYDCSQDGWNLLHFAMVGKSMEVIKFLLKNGLDLRERNNDGHNPVDQAFNEWSDLEDCRQMYRVAFDEEVLPLPLVRQLMWKDPDGVKSIANELFTDYDPKLSTSDFRYVDWNYINATMLLQAIEEEGICSADFRAQLRRSPNGSTYSFAVNYFWHQAESFPEFHDWRLLARWMLAGVPLEVITRKFADTDPTALLYSLCSNGPSTAKSFSDGARPWLEDLLAAGIDLEAYGERERNAYMRICSGTGTWPFAQPSYHGERSWLVSFTYGPRPEHWSYVWDPVVEEYAGDFWLLVEPPPVKIPGAWVDEDEDE